jgi:hypothetical protein
MSNYNVTRFFKEYEELTKRGLHKFFFQSTNYSIEKIFFLPSLQKFFKLKKYSRWKINIINQHKILYQKLKKI